jgi:tetratricopeptide (TPR) repeat protein
LRRHRSIETDLWTTGLVAVALAAGIGAAPARADVSEQVPVGVRGIAMSGAFGSLADDASALFWNPAGLPWVGHQELTATQSDLYQSGIKDNYTAFVVPFSRSSAAGLGWYHSGYDDGVLGYGENRIDLAWGWKPRAWLSAGGTFKYLSRSTQLDGTAVRDGSGTGWDLGLIATPAEGLRFGLAGQDLFDTRINDTQAGSVIAYPRNVRIGGSWAWRQLGTVALDLDDRWHLGLEVTPIPQLAVRGGVQREIAGGEGATWSAGLGIKAGIFRLDYALVQHPVLDATHTFGLSLDFNFNPSDVKVEKVTAHDVFASQVRSYAHEPIGTVKLRNLRDRPIEADLSVYAPELMDGPSHQTVVLRPQATQELPLLAPLSPRVLSQNGDRPAQVQVSASYQSRRLMRTEKGAAKLVAYGPGAIDWSQGTDQAAAFVTPRDPAVETVARQAARAAEHETTLPSRNMTLLAAECTAVTTLDVAYVPDPNNPFETMSETPKAVDTIQYPSETLAKRTGDCDDTTVLLAALLASVGVNSRFVDAPGHIFLMADAGIHEHNRLALAMDEDRYAVVDDEIWIPIETTALGKGFAEAWRIGADSYGSWNARNQIRTFDVAAASGRWEPSNPPGAEAPAVLDSARFAGRLATEMAVVAGWTTAYRQEHYAGADHLIPTPAALDEVARVYASAGKLDDARGRLEQALAIDPRSAQVRNDLGVVLAGLGELPAALDNFRSVLELDASDAGVWLNDGLVRVAAGDSAGAATSLAIGVARAGGEAKATALLTLTGESGAAPALVSADRITTLLHRAAATPPRSLELPPSRRPAHPITATGQPTGLDRLLYWKP